MDFNSTLDIIINDLGEARKIIEDFKQYPGVPLLQVELAKSKCKSAEELIALLKSIKQETMIPQTEKRSQTKISKPGERVIKETLFEISDEEIPENPMKPEKSEPKKTIKADPVETEIFSDISVFSGASVVDKTGDTNIVADKFSGLSSTIHEKLGINKGEGDISAAMNARHINNLTEVIGINEKFLYVREVFKGNQAFYNEAIAKLNKVENLPDAKAVIMSYTGESEESDAVKQLLELVKRKLPANE